MDNIFIESSRVYTMSKRYVGHKPITNETLDKIVICRNHYINDTLVLDSEENIKKKFVGKVVRPGNNGNLFFTKASSFPRFKLKNSEGFKKVTKLEDADYIPYNPSKIFSRLSWNTWWCNSPIVVFTLKTSSTVVMITNESLKEMTGKSIGQFNGITDLKNFIKYTAIGEHNAYNSYSRVIDISLGVVNPEMIDEVFIVPKACMVSKDITDFMVGVYYGLYPPILIKDKDLDKVVSQSLMQIDPSTLDTAVSVLSSSSYENCEVGWKSLQSMDLSRIPNVVKFLVHSYSGHISHSLLNSVGFQNMLNSAGIDPKRISKTNKSPEIVFGGYLNGVVFSEEEAQLMSHILKGTIEKSLKAVVDGYLKKFESLNPTALVEFDFKP